jgi:4-diphosphocytidyl-2-C-methyl-D-erythritol kinase
LASDRPACVVAVRAFAKINLTLKVLANRDDGYHEVRTVLQAVDLHDALTFRVAPGPFRIETRDPTCPTDRTNLVWRAAAHLWRAIGRSGPLRNVCVQIDKGIPAQAGLGGGSSDAAATLKGLAVLWRVKPGAANLPAIAAKVGADVPFFFEGGTALGLGRGDIVVPLLDWSRSWIVLVVPEFGVSTKDAYFWFDRDLRSRPRPRPLAQSSDWHPASPKGWTPPVQELRNDLQDPVVRRHAALGSVLSALRRSGAAHAAMSGSGSGVFGLFARRDKARSAAALLARAGHRTLLTKTLTRAEYRARAAASLVPVTHARSTDGRSRRAANLPHDRAIV